jgi:alpha-amylase
MVRVHFECNCPTQWGEEIFIVGSHEAIGKWDSNKAIHLTCYDLSRWRASVEFPDDFKNAIEYKYVLFNRQNQEFIIEGGKKDVLFLKKGDLMSIF